MKSIGAAGDGSVKERRDGGLSQETAPLSK